MLAKVFRGSDAKVELVLVGCRYMATRRGRRIRFDCRYQVADERLIFRLCSHKSKFRTLAADQVVAHRKTQDHSKVLTLPL